MRYRLAGPGGAWTDVTGITSNTFYDAPGSTFSVAGFEWQVRTYDALGAVGPFAASEFFNAGDVPATPTITTPAVNATVSVTAAVVWSAPTQASYQVRTVGDLAGAPDTATVYSNTGEVISVPVRTVTANFPINNRFEHVQVRIKLANLWSVWATARVLASYTSPSPGVVTVSGETLTASLLVTLVAAAVGPGEPTPVTVDVYIREIDQSGYGDLRAVGLAPTGEWRWWTPASGVEYAIRSLTHADNDATRWSVLEITHYIDGNTAETSVWTLYLDGGLPGTVFTKLTDGGIP